MNITTSSASSPRIFKYDLEGQRVTVSLSHNPFAFETRTLFSLAARKNKKRGFLFVSNVLGKHVPVDPFIPLLAGQALAVQFLKQIFGEDHSDTQAIIAALKGQEQTKKVFETIREKPAYVLPRKTVFIGFAETATGLGHSVFSLFANAHYLHTTREQIALVNPTLNFSEDHSHAVDHRCYPLNTDFLQTSQTVVLVDDEITTGNTALNIIHELHGKFPKQEYVVLSLLDWRTETDREKYRELECQLGITIQTIALMGGELEITGTPDHDRLVQVVLSQEDTSSKEVVFPECIRLNCCEEVPIVSEDSLGNRNLTPYLKLTGRFGISSEENQKILSLARRIGERLKNNRTGRSALCLGSGEFMYFPMLIAAYMGQGVRYHSTTRSPMYPFAKPEYGIKNGFAFENPDNACITNYVYNIPPNYYDEVYLFMERDVEQEKLKSLLSAFYALDIPRLVLIQCVSSR